MNQNIHLLLIVQSLLQFLLNRPLAPALLLVVFLIKEFGFRKFIDGIVLGLATAFAIISPYLLLGGSPTMLFNSTLFRLFQFSTTTFQYPRSAAVSPDGYNIWPLFTYFQGATSRERMWYPDYLPSPFFGVSLLSSWRGYFYDNRCNVDYFGY